MISDAFDHVAATLVRRHGIEKLGPAIENANPIGAVDFMPREGVEIAVQVLNIDGAVRDRVGAIDEDGNPARLGQGDDFFGRVDRA